ncbi:MAG: DUF2987 domain-containing protein [Paraglaciecola polaris]|mgnify:CR=1 FL=1|uniref:DUF2987 domain-containing protein n=1 Tax=Paraglaciecola polaris TaxID=222814 RepID=UPI0030010BD5|tara:strand:- start:1066 stop:1734 length:669 start_codon:yes stop_codon:yes gene_type:complete
MKKWLLAACIMQSCLAVAQEEPNTVFKSTQPSVNVDYSNFYSHVRKLSAEDTNALQFAFGFKHVRTGALCHITSGYIHTQKQDIPLTISAEQRFTVPSEKALKLANAKVALTIIEPANQCDMSVQLETTPQWLKSEYSSEELALLFGQYQTFFDDMGSFLAFLMPSVDGLVIHFSDHKLTRKLENGLQIDNGRLLLDKRWLGEEMPLSLPYVPLRITAKTTR